jgi:dipeptidyl aminopeptidase/acylaminoacyl peptidase
VASQYRGNAGGEGKEEFGGRDVDDVLNLIKLLISLPQADAKRIGMYGWSRGGMMTYQALARSDQVAAAIVGAGVTDAFDMGAHASRPANRFALNQSKIAGYRPVQYSDWFTTCWSPDAQSRCQV